MDFVTQDDAAPPAEGHPHPDAKVHRELFALFRSLSVSALSKDGPALARLVHDASLSYRGVIEQAISSLREINGCEESAAGWGRALVFWQFAELMYLWPAARAHMPAGAARVAFREQLADWAQQLLSLYPPDVRGHREFGEPLSNDEAARAAADPELWDTVADFLLVGDYQHAADYLERATLPPAALPDAWVREVIGALRAYPGPSADEPALVRWRTSVGAVARRAASDAGATPQHLGPRAVHGAAALLSALRTGGMALEPLAAHRGLATWPVLLLAHALWSPGPLAPDGMPGMLKRVQAKAVHACEADDLLPALAAASEQPTALLVLSPAEAAPPGPGSARSRRNLQPPSPHCPLAATAHLAHLLMLASQVPPPPAIAVLLAHAETLALDAACAPDYASAVIGYIGPALLSAPPPKVQRRCVALATTAVTRALSARGGVSDSAARRLLAVARAAGIAEAARAVCLASARACVRRGVLGHAFWWLAQPVRPRAGGAGSARGPAAASDDAVAGDAQCRAHAEALAAALLRRALGDPTAASAGAAGAPLAAAAASAPWEGDPALAGLGARGVDWWGAQLPAFARGGRRGGVAELVASDGDDGTAGERPPSTALAVEDVAGVLAGAGAALARGSPSLEALAILAQLQLVLADLAHLSRAHRRWAALARGHAELDADADAGLGLDVGGAVGDAAGDAELRRVSQVAAQACARGLDLLRALVDPARPLVPTSCVGALVHAAAAPLLSAAQRVVACGLAPPCAASTVVVVSEALELAAARPVEGAGPVAECDGVGAEFSAMGGPRPSLVPGPSAAFALAPRQAWEEPETVFEARQAMLQLAALSFTAL